MRFLFTVKYLFQSNFSPLNVSYYLKDLKDRARATHVAINILPPLFPTRSRDLLTYCGAFTAGGRGLPSDCSPPEKERQLKKSGNPSFKQPSSGISNSLFSFLSFFFFHRWRESMKFERGLPLLPSPSPSRNVGVYARKQITGRQAARIASTPSWTLLLFTGKPAFRGGNGALS